MAQAAVALADGGLGSPLPIRFSRIERFEGQPRTYFNKAGIESLADSIQTDRQQQPIKVCTKPGEPGRFILIDGERRLKAFALIYERTGVEPIIDAFIEVVHDLKQHFRKSTIANLHREDLTTLDEAAAYHRLRNDGETVAGLARLKGKSTTYIENYLRIHELPEEVKALMDPELPKESQLTATQAIDIARGIPKTATQLRITVAREAVERNLSGVETRSLISHRTGATEHRVGGRLRKPSDDYKVFAAFLGRTRKTTKRLLDDLEIAELYAHRDDDKGDRSNHLIEIDAIIAQFERLREKVRGT